MKSIVPKAWMLVFISALLQILCFPIAGQIPVLREGICWFALVPLLVALLQPDQEGKDVRVKQGALLGYVCGIIWYTGNCSWIYQTMYLYGGMAKPVAFVILILFSLYLGLYHALFASLVTCIKSCGLGRIKVLILVPFLWVAVELARTRITGFPWDLLGNAPIDHSLVKKLAPLAGVMAISFVVAAVNAGLAAVVIVAERSWLQKSSFCLAVVLLLQVSGSGYLRARHPQQSADQTAVMMQENLAVGATAREQTPLSRDAELLLFSQLSLRPDAAEADVSTPIAKQRNATGPALIVWPEAPSHLQSNDPAFRVAIGNLARTAGATVVAGSLGVDPNPIPPRGYYLYDSAAIFDPKGGFLGRYDKVHLVPWGEYIPYKEFFSFAQKLTEGVGDMDPGHARTVFQSGGHTYGVFICYESIFGDEVREFVKSGAEALVNISDDGWYGDTGAPWQHLNMARMRAIENRRWVLRSTNTGITTTIDPHGHYIETPRHVRVAYALPFAFTTGQTFYTRHGDWFAYLCAGVTLFALGFSLKRRMN